MRSKDCYNQGFLEATFKAKKSLQKLEKHYATMKPSPDNYQELRSRMEGFMDGLEKRKRSRLNILQRALQQSRELNRDELER